MKSGAAAAFGPICTPNFQSCGRTTKTRKSMLSQAGSPCRINGFGCLINSISPEVETSATAAWRVRNSVWPANVNAGSAALAPKSRSYLKVKRCTSGP